MKAQDTSCKGKGRQAGTGKDCGLKRGRISILVYFLSFHTWVALRTLFKRRLGVITPLKANAEAYDTLLLQHRRPVYGDVARMPLISSRTPTLDTSKSLP